MPRASTVAAARRTRSSSPSGSTMCRALARARSMQLVLEHERRDDGRSGASAEQVEQRLGVDVLLEQRERGVVPALRVGGEPAAGVHDRAPRSRRCRGRSR